MAMPMMDDEEDVIDEEDAMGDGMDEEDEDGMPIKKRRW